MTLKPIAERIRAHRSALKNSPLRQAKKGSISRRQAADHLRSLRKQSGK